MKILLLLTSFILRVFGWYKCTELQVQQTLCNRTDSLMISNCTGYSKSNCFYDYIQSQCICNYVVPCSSDFLYTYPLANLTYSVSLRNTGSRTGRFSLSNLIFQGQNSYTFNTTANSSITHSLIPTYVMASYNAKCNGNTVKLIDANIKFNSTYNFELHPDCYDDQLEFWYQGTPIFDYYHFAFNLDVFKGAFYSKDFSNFGKMLAPQDNSFSDEWGTFMCTTFEYVKEKNSASDQCIKYSSRTWYDGNLILITTMDYISSNQIILTVKKSSQVLGHSHVSFVEYTYLKPDVDTTNTTITLPKVQENYIHKYYAYISMRSDSCLFTNFVIVLDQHSYQDDEHYFTKQDPCKRQQFFSTHNVQVINELCCIGWKTGMKAN